MSAASACAVRSTSSCSRTPRRRALDTVIALGARPAWLSICSRTRLARRRRARRWLRPTSAASADCWRCRAMRRIWRGAICWTRTAVSTTSGYIRQQLPDTPVVLVQFAGRVPGLIVPPGNPLGITRLKIWHARTCCSSTASAARARACCSTTGCEQLGIDASAGPRLRTRGVHPPGRRRRRRQRRRQHRVRHSRRRPSARARLRAPLLRAVPAGHPPPPLRVRSPRRAPRGNPRAPTSPPKSTPWAATKSPTWARSSGNTRL